MRAPAILLLTTLLLLAISAAACGTTVSSVDAQASPGSSGGPAPSGPAPGGPPSCSFTVDGAVALSAPETSPSAVLLDGAGVYLLGIWCSYTQGDVTYELDVNLDDVIGPSTYTASAVGLTPSCVGPSCPLDYGFSASAPSPTCTVVLDTLAPATRGGMSGSFTCPNVLVVDYDDPDDTQSVAIHGAFVFPPAEAGEVEGAGTSGDAGADGGPPTCTMQVSAPFDSGTLAGVGQEMSGLATCAASGGGVTFTLGVPVGEAAPGFGSLDVDGASFCSADCDEAYMSPGSCDLDVLEDEGVGGRFAAQIVCHGLVLDGLAFNADGGTVDVTAHIDGIHEPPPPAPQ